MSVCKELTPVQLAARLCKFIPELEPGAVLYCLQQSGQSFFDPACFHEWLRYFDSLVIDGKEGVFYADGSQRSFHGF